MIRWEQSIETDLDKISSVGIRIALASEQHTTLETTMKKKNIKSLTSKLKKYKKRIDKLEARLEKCEKSCCPADEPVENAAEETEVKAEVAEPQTNQVEESSD